MKYEIQRFAFSSHLHEFKATVKVQVNSIQSIQTDCMNTRVLLGDGCTDKSERFKNATTQMHIVMKVTFKDAGE